ncbi:Asp-tRNA(Asn)/Glu-tRNA(Gln) amidotransferase subunit GatC [bacterium]|nr:Asp-tRNA(Asn)/Glu-tRNA(Gln) amidotransferase subunit GatC [bacterium]
MAKQITTEDIKRIARLANINLSPEELETFTAQIGDILAYVDKLSQLDTKGAVFKSQTDLSNIFREDIVEESLSSDKATQNRPKSSKKGYIAIKSVLNK